MIGGGLVTLEKVRVIMYRGENGAGVRGAADRHLPSFRPRQAAPIPLDYLAHASASRSSSSAPTRATTPAISPAWARCCARWAPGRAAGLLLLPEAALTGYFLEGGVRELARPAEQMFDDLARVHRESGAPPLDLALGFYEVWRNRLYNSALYATPRRHRRRHPPRPSQGLPADLRRLRRGALRRAGPQHPGLRHPVGPLPRSWSARTPGTR